MKQTVEEHVSTADLLSRGPQTREDRPEDRPPQPQSTPRDEAPAPLLPADYVSDLRAHWQNIQVGFVDDPKTAVRQADELVAEAIQRLTQSFADSRGDLERQWNNGADVENLRLSFRKYRSFFEHLLSV